MVGSVFVLFLLVTTYGGQSQGLRQYPADFEHLQLPSSFPSDLLLFIAVPVQRPRELREAEGGKVLVEAVQVVDEGRAAIPGDEGIAVQRLRDGTNVSFRTSSLSESFLADGDLPRGVFNLQVPFVIPLELDFMYTPESTPLKMCSVDLRTWRENSITHIMNQLGLPDVPKWNRGPVREKVSLIKDIMASRTHEDLHNNSEATVDLLQYVCWALSLAEVLYHDFLGNSPLRGPQYQTLRAEGVDTYRLLQNRTALLHQAFQDLNVSTSISDELDNVKNKITSSLDKLSS